MHSLSQLIRGERLAKTHFGIPEKMWRLVQFFSLDVREVSRCFFNRLTLLGTHCEVERSIFDIQLAIADGNNGLFYLRFGATEPLTIRIVYANATQITMDFVVSKCTSVAT